MFLPDNGGIRINSDSKDLEVLKKAVDDLSPPKSESTEDVKIAKKDGHSYAIIPHLGKDVRASTLILTLQKANIVAQETLASPRLVNVEEREQVKSEIKSRDHIIEQLKEKIESGKEDVKISQLLAGAWKTAKAGLVTLGLGTVAATAIAGGGSLLLAGAAGAGVIAAGVGVGVALTSPITVPLYYLQKAYKNRGITKKGLKDAELLMKNLNANPSSKAQKSEGATLPSFSKIYNTMTLFIARLEKHPNGIKKPDLDGTDKVLSRENQALRAALGQGKIDDAKFIIKNGLFSKVNSQLLKAINDLPTQDLDDKAALLELLFDKCNDTESLSKITAYLQKTGQKELAIKLIRKGFSEVPPLKLFEVRKSKAIKNHVLLELKRARCQTLAASMGDLSLFNEAIKGSGIVISAKLFEQGNEKALKAAVGKFLDLENSCLEDMNKRGDTILHHAAAGGDTYTNVFLREVFLLKKKEDTGGIETNVLKPLAAIKNGESLTVRETASLRAGLDGLMTLLEAGKSRPWFTTGYKGVIPNLLRPSRQMNALYSFVRTNDPGRLIKQVRQMQTILEKGIKKLRSTESGLKKNEIKEGVLDPNAKVSLQQNAHLRQLASRLTNKIEEAKGELQNVPDPYLMKNKEGIRPVELMSMGLANSIDNLMEINGNATGSLSNAVGYFQIISRDISKKVSFGGGIAGKYGGAVGATAVLNANPQLGTLLGGLASNSLLIGGIVAGTVLFRAIKRYASRTRKASNLGIVNTLSLYNNKTKIRAESASSVNAPEPIRLKVSVQYTLNDLSVALKKRDLTRIKTILDADKKHTLVLSKKVIKSMRTMHSFYIEGKDERSVILQQLFERCPNKKTAFRLLNDQVNKGHSTEVAKTISGVMTSLEGRTAAELSPQQQAMVETSLLVGAHIGNLPENPTFLETLISQTKNLGMESTLLTATTPKTGDNVLHRAAQSGQASAVTILADEMIKASKGKEIEFTRPRIGLTRYIKKDKTISTQQNVYEMKNGEGKKIYDMIDRNLANQLDEIHAQDPLKTGSFTSLYQRRLDQHKNELLAEVLAVGPIKATLNIAGSSLLPALISGSAVFLDAHIPGSGVAMQAAVLLGQAAVMFGLELSVMVTGFGSALALGHPLGEGLTQIKERMAGRHSELTQFASTHENMQARATQARKRAQEDDTYHQPLTEQLTEIHKVALNYALNEYIALYEKKADLLLQEDLEVLKNLKANLSNFVRVGALPREIQKIFAKKLDGLSQEDKVGFGLNYAKGLDIAFKDKIVLPRAYTPAPFGQRQPWQEESDPDLPPPPVVG